MPKTVLITGAGGMLGSDLLIQLRKKAEGTYAPLGITRKECDLTLREPLFQLLSRIEPHIIIHCAAFTQVDVCETQREKAFLANGTVTRNLAEFSARAGARLIYVSTDYVFDGEKATPYDEEDPTFPRSVYGLSKREGELAALTLREKGTIVRTSWLFGQNGPNFVKTILHKAKAEGKLRVVSDQRGRPTYTPDLAEGILNLMEKEASGIFHVCNAGACTWFDFTVEILKQAGLEGVHLTPVSTKEFPRPAPRPKNSVLSCEKFNRLTGKPLRNWREALGNYLASLQP